MRINLKIIVLVVFLSLLFTFEMSSQVGIYNIDEIAKVKEGTTYVIVGGQDSVVDERFIEVLKNNWTFSKIDFVKYGDLEKCYIKGNSFLTLTMGGTEVQGSLKYTNIHWYLDLWSVSDSYLQNVKKNKKKKGEVGISIARLELYKGFKNNNIQELYKTIYTDNKIIHNWGPGLLKNHIQSMIANLNKMVKKSLYSQVNEAEKLKTLSNQTLYVPDYVLNKFNAFNGDESKKYDEKELFEDYKSSYQVITTKELNDKILNDKVGFYYLQYIKSSTDKYVSVINSLTGEVIYSVYTPVSYNIKTEDLKDLYKKILKG